MTHPLVIFGDVVEEVAAPLRTLLAGRSEPETDDVEVHGEVPNPRPAKFIELRRDGGVSPAVILDRPRLTVRCWHEADAEAERLAQITRALIKTLPGTGAIRRVVDAGGPNPAPDESGAATYFFSVEITLRGDE